MIRELGKDGNIKFGSFITGSPMVAQNVTSRLKFWKNENPFNLDEGIDYINNLPVTDVEKMNVIFADVIKTTPGVLSIVGDLDSYIDVEKRVFNVTVYILTVYSPTPEKIKVSI